jgi:hypothetical protein
MGIAPLDLNAVQSYTETLRDDPVARAGAAYVLTGAHLMGGEIMRRRLVDLPTEHLEWEDRQAALAELKVMRVNAELAGPARKCFEALLAIMDEILERRADC